MTPKVDFDTRIYSLQTASRGWFTKSDVEANFRRRSNWYKWKLLPFLPKNHEVLIVDFGCGAGNFLYFLRDSGYRNHIGIDSDPNMVALGTELGLSVLQGNAVDYMNTMSCNPGVIVCFDFLEHLEKSEAVEFMAKSLSTLLPGGTMLIRVPCADGILGAHDWANDLTHEWVATTNVWNNLLRQLGCKDVTFIDELLAPTNFVQTLRYVAARVIRPLVTFAIGLAGLPRPKVHSTSVTIVAIKR
jgi:SAM-dependent methyltransferase